MLWKVLRRLAVVGFAGGLVVVFVLTSYLSFSNFVRRGETHVPELTNLDIEEATQLLSAQGLTLRVREELERFDPDIRPGAVVDQSPHPGSQVKRGAVIEVTRSLGRQLVSVPDLSGQTLQTAEVNLRAAGLNVGRLARVYSDSGAEERIVRQSPAAGVDVDHQAPIDLFLSLGNAADTFVMPDLVYREYEGVRKFFERRGFRVGSVKYEPYEGIEPGVVLRQFPLAGHRLGRTDVISLVVAAAEPSPAGVL